MKKTYNKLQYAKDNRTIGYREQYKRGHLKENE